MDSVFGSSPCSSVYFIGIKGTGVCALAEFLHGQGAKTCGSDIPEAFYTDAILKELGIPFHESFDPTHIGDDIDLVIHSAAYSEENNVELAEARRKGIPIATYPDALGAYSAGFDSTGVTGVHGKTTTTAMCGCLVQALGLPARVLVGSAVANFGGKSTLVLGDKYFVAETCEYKKHFLAFRPQRIILTAVESDHQDFFPTYESIRDAFVEYCRLIPAGGQLIYCADDPGANEVAGIIEGEGRGVVLVPYGFSIGGDYGIASYRVCDDAAMFRLNAFSVELCLRVPGRHQALNAAAALALADILLKKEFDEGWNDERRAAARKALVEFTGSKRRAEVIGTAGGIVFMDDYGHHPTAIRSTIEGLRNFYPSRRIVVSFMSHTFTRTAALLDEFADSLSGADVLFLHKIYASARERFDGHLDGMSIHERIADLRGEKAVPVLHYIAEPLDAFGPLKDVLQPGDLFLTLGAGNNWPLGVRLFEYYRDGGAS
ncbi:MAG: UDP-N-acetylmuramate--L-alanine ligase [Treponema sp.]|nr:UDP-N-acetylmuramate--L-alanine ligase [Treponema sp.]